MISVRTVTVGIIELQLYYTNTKYKGFYWLMNLANVYETQNIILLAKSYNVANFNLTLHLSTGYEFSQYFSTIL